MAEELYRKKVIVERIREESPKISLRYFATTLQKRYIGIDNLFQIYHAG